MGKALSVLVMVVLVAFLAVVLQPGAALADEENPPTIEMPEPFSLSTNVDGHRNRSRISFLSSESALGTVTIVTAEGDVVRTIATDIPLGTTRFFQNVTPLDDDGNPLPDGWYDLTVVATDRQGDTTVATTMLAIYGAGAPTVTPDLDRTTVDGEVEIVVTPDEGATITGIQNFPDRLNFTNAGDRTWRGSWDSRTVVDGRLTLRATIRWVDPFGFTKTTAWSADVTVENGPDSPDLVTVLRQSPDKSFSPNGDTYEESLLIYFGVSRPALFNIKVTNDQGDVVRGLANRSDELMNLTTRWNGRDRDNNLLPEGEYFVNLVATSADGNKAFSTMRTTIEYTVTMPGTFSAPLNGVTVSGTEELVFTPAPDVDVSLVGFATKQVSFEQAEQQDDDTWRYLWDTVPEQDGPTEVKAFVFWDDMYGTMHASIQFAITVNVDNGVFTPIEITAKSSARSFSPNGDGYEDNLSRRHFYLSESPASATITVSDMAGTVVRSLENLSGQSERIDVAWNGLDDNGVVVAEGRYNIDLVVVDDDGNTAEDFVSTAVRLERPVQIDSPVDDSVVEGVVDVVVVPGDGNKIQRVTIQPSLDGGLDRDGRWLATWDTTLTPDGLTSLEVLTSWRDEFDAWHPGFPQQLDLTISNRSGDPIEATTTSPDQAFSPDDDGNEDSVTAEFELSRLATNVAVTVVDTDGNTIRTLPAIQTPDYRVTVEWDGADDGGVVVADGLYQIEIEVLDVDDNAASSSMTVQVATLPPAGFTSPAAGSTVAGFVDVIVTPSIDASIAYIRTSGGFTARLRPSEGGLWRATWDTRTVIDGPQRITADVGWFDEFGPGASIQPTLKLLLTTRCNLRSLFSASQPIVCSRPTATGMTRRTGASSGCRDLPASH